MRVAFVLVALTLTTPCFGQPTNFSAHNHCFDAEALAAIGNKVKGGTAVGLVERTPIARVIMQICAQRYPNEAAKSAFSFQFIETIVQDHLNHAMDADLNRKIVEQRKKEDERRKTVAPLLEAEDKAASEKYGDCLFQHARILAQNSSETADTIARAAFASCRSERAAITEVHRRYQDSGFSPEVLDYADKRLVDIVVLEIIQSRATLNR